MKNVKTFPVSDFVLASYLLCKGIKLNHLDRSQRRVDFCFLAEPKAQIMRLTRAFWGGEAIVEPKAFHNCQRVLKNRLYNES